MVEWEDLANLADGTIVQVLGNMRKRRRTGGNRMGREFQLGRKKFLGRMVARLRRNYGKKRDRAEQREKKIEEGSEGREPEQGQ